MKRPDGRREIAGEGATAGSSSCFISEESSVGFAADVSAALSCGASEAGWSSAFLSGVLISGNTTAGLVSEAACGKPLTSADDEVVSVDDFCGKAGDSVRDLSCGLSLLGSEVVDWVDGAGVEAGDGETGDEVVLNDGIGSSVSFETDFGSGFVIEIGTAVGAGVAAAAGGALGVFDEADDCVVLAGDGGLLVSSLVGSDAGTVAMAEAGDGDGDGAAGADTGVDGGAGVAVGVAVGDGGVSGLMVNGGIGVDGVVAGDGEVDEAGATGVTDEDSDGCIDVGSGFSIGCGAAATGALGGVDNDTVGCGATGWG